MNKTKIEWCDSTSLKGGYAPGISVEDERSAT